MTVSAANVGPKMTSELRLLCVFCPTVKDVQKAWKLFELQMCSNFIDAYHASLCYKLIPSVTFDMSDYSSTNS